jgi:Fe-S-cluster-containing dehydrogenase component/DMSO reductase anchor subunit
VRVRDEWFVSCVLECFVSLPLLERVADDSVTFGITPRSGVRPAGSRSTPRGSNNDTCGAHALDGRMPSRTPEPGEQYRFHVDMRRCIGCKCCVVACNEQNGNPAAINWRRVGEVEGGWYPNAHRAYLSMGCNHCVNPTCLSGCPVDAYTKDPVTGIVGHSADACIGCQYCTWNCSYGVPQYNPERGVVGKCDMCHGRLQLGQAPACVSACPEGAIQIEIVNTDRWRAAVAASAGSEGMPAGDCSLSTTRVTMPAQLPPDTRPVEITHVTPEHAHWSLVMMTVLTQLSVGGFVSIWLLQLLGGATRLGVAALTSLLVAAIALNGATLHLGRPAYAYRALKMWRRSWLSREVLLFTAFAGVAGIYAALLWLELQGSLIVGGVTSLVGIAGVTASGCIYRVPSRPAWNTRLTLVQFNLTAAALGPLLAATLGVTVSPVSSDARWLAWAAATMAGTQLVFAALRFVRMVAANSVELRGTARLLSTTLRSQFITRGILLAIGGIVLPLLAADAAAWWAALAVALAAEILGRYLFFVSVVPKHMAAAYLQIGSETA